MSWYEARGILTLEPMSHLCLTTAMATPSKIMHNKIFMLQKCDSFLFSFPFVYQGKAESDLMMPFISYSSSMSSVLRCFIFSLASLLHFHDVHLQISTNYSCCLLYMCEVHKQVFSSNFVNIL